MLMNYHEMTMNEPRDSPARRKQFLVICTVMVAALVHSMLGAGALSSVTIEEGVFSGGEFIYKDTKRDYAASGSLEEAIGKKDAGLKNKEFVDNLFTVYLDDPNKMGGRRQRFASGLLIGSNSLYADKKDVLLSKNEERIPPTLEELQTLGAVELWPKLEYQTVTFPQVKAATVQFAYTGGFVSAFVLGMKIIPALRQYAKEHNDGGPVAVISTCSYLDQMCTHYAPLAEGQVFLFGEDDTETYLEKLGPEEFINQEGMGRMFKMIWRRVEPFFEMVGIIKKEKAEEKSAPDEPELETVVAEETRAAASQPGSVAQDNEAAPDDVNTEADSSEAGVQSDEL